MKKKYILQGLDMSGRGQVGEVIHEDIYEILNLNYVTKDKERFQGIRKVEKMKCQAKGTELAKSKTEQLWK